MRDDWMTPLDMPAAGLHSLGPPAIGVKIKICDADGRSVPQGEIGEFASQCGTGMRGYWGMPEAAAALERSERTLSSTPDSAEGNHVGRGARMRSVQQPDWPGFHVAISTANPAFSSVP